MIVLSMPPALAPNEAVFCALVRQQGQVRVFFYERCRDMQGNLSPDDAVLSAMTGGGEDYQRTNFGFFKGLGLASFKENLGRVLGVSLEGLEQSLPPVTYAPPVAQDPYRAGPPVGNFAAAYQQARVPNPGVYSPYVTPRQTAPP